MKTSTAVMVFSAVLAMGLPFPLSAQGPSSEDKPEGAEWEKRIASLVEKLGHDEYTRREAAQRALLEEGPRILPVLDKLGPPTDPEIQFRLRRIRYRLRGFLDDIRDSLAALPDVPPGSRPPIPDTLRQLILTYQPKSGDLLLSIIADVNEKLNRRAANVLVHTWNSMTPAQFERYFQHTMEPRAKPRKQYPQGVDALIEMGYGWGGWPHDKSFELQTVTNHFLDGKPYGKPFAYQGPGACTGWVRTKDLTVGKHTLRLATEYKYVRENKTYSGRAESKPYEFEMVSADTPDDLVAPHDPKIDQLVRNSLQFSETRPLPRHVIERGFPLDPRRDPWEPQITWRSGTGESGSLHMPLWKLTRQLPVDLCFAVEIHIEQTGEVYEGYPLVVLAGREARGYFSPRESVSGFAKGQDGLIPLKIVLKPSRATALTNTKVTQYYPGTITSKVLRAKAVHP